MKNNFPKISLFFSIVAFLFSCFFFFYFLRATNNNNQKSQMTDGQWQAELDRRDEIRALDNSVKIIAGERAQLETHFAQSSDIVPFLDTIEGLGSETLTKAQVTSVNISGDQSGLLVGMKATGTFPGLYKFLTLLENSPYEIEFSGVDVQEQSGVDPSSKTLGVPKWNATFNIKLLSFVQ